MKRRWARGAAATAAAVTALVALPSAARADYPDRTGARVGVSLLGGVAAFSRSGEHGVSTTTPMVGAALRFGGAFSDRVHLYGEFTLAALPGASFDATQVTAFLGSLDLGVQVFVLSSLYARAGIGAVEHATLGNGQYWALPGPHITGAVGYDVFRTGERAFALEVLAADDFFEGTGTPYNRGYDVALGVLFDWF